MTGRLHHSPEGLENKLDIRRQALFPDISPGVFDLCWQNFTQVFLLRIRQAIQQLIFIPILQ
jgi:hypothetical protein